MINTAIPLFRRQYLDESAADSLTSSPVDVEGNQAVLSVTAINISGGTLTVSLEGSYDGLAWFNLATVAGLTSFNFASITKGTLDAAQVRARAVVTTTGAKAIFDVTVSFSEQ